MKNVFLFFLFALLGNAVKSQDTLLMNDGSEMYVKVLEIGENTISYKKTENLTGPTYSANLSKVFMAVYKGGRREIFKNSNDAGSENKNNQQSNELSQNDQPVSLGNDEFEVKLVESKGENKVKRNDTSITVTGAIDAYYNGRFFCKLSLVAYQSSSFSKNDFDFITAGKLRESYVSIFPVTDNIAHILFEKYETQNGYGYGWALMPSFFKPETSNCSIALLEQKHPFNKEAGLWAGKMNVTNFSLQDCSIIEKRLLSIALIWLHTNFAKK